jgi:hypothetical protein
VHPRTARYRSAASASLIGRAAWRGEGDHAATHLEAAAFGSDAKWHVPVRASAWCTPVKACCVDHRVCDIRARLDSLVGSSPCARRSVTVREEGSSRADANPAPIEADDVAELQLPSSTAINFTVDSHVAVDDGLLHISTGVEEPSKLQELAEADALAADRNVVDRSLVRHPGMLADQMPTASGSLCAPSWTSDRGLEPGP